MGDIGWMEGYFDYYRVFLAGGLLVFNCLNVNKIFFFLELIKGLFGFFFFSV